MMENPSFQSESQQLEQQIQLEESNYKNAIQRGKDYATLRHIRETIRGLKERLRRLKEKVGKYRH